MAPQAPSPGVCGGAEALTTTLGALGLNIALYGLYTYGLYSPFMVYMAVSYLFR